MSISLEDLEELELAAAQCSSSSSTDNSQDSDSQYSATASHITEDEAAGKSPVLILILSPPPHSVFMSEIEVWFNEENGAEADLRAGESAGEIEGKTKIIFILNVSKSPPHLLL